MNVPPAKTKCLPELFIHRNSKHGTVSLDKDIACGRRRNDRMCGKVSAHTYHPRPIRDMDNQRHGLHRHRIHLRPLRRGTLDHGSEDRCTPLLHDRAYGRFLLLRPLYALLRELFPRRTDDFRMDILHHHAPCGISLHGHGDYPRCEMLSVNPSRYLTPFITDIIRAMIMKPMKNVMPINILARRTFSLQAFMSPFCHSFSTLQAK